MEAYHGEGTWGVAGDTCTNMTVSTRDSWSLEERHLGKQIIIIQTINCPHQRYN